MKRLGCQHPRKLFSEFSSRLGGETLNIRIYRENLIFICERKIVERDGTSFTMLIPFSETETITRLLASDPFVTKLQGQVRHIEAKLNQVLRDKNGKALS